LKIIIHFNQRNRETLEHPYFSKSNHQDLFIMIPYYWKFPYYIHDVTIHMKDQIEELMNNSSINNQVFFSFFFFSLYKANLEIYKINPYFNLRNLEL